MLLSGKMHMQVAAETTCHEMKYGRPVVVERPYLVFCPKGPGTGRALRIPVPGTGVPGTAVPGKPALR